MTQLLDMYLHKNFGCYVISAHPLTRNCDDLDEDFEILPQQPEIETPVHYLHKNYVMTRPQQSTQTMPTGSYIGLSMQTDGPACFLSSISSTNTYSKIVDEPLTTDDTTPVLIPTPVTAHYSKILPSLLDDPVPTSDTTNVLFPVDLISNAHSTQLLYGESLPIVMTTYDADICSIIDEPSSLDITPTLFPVAVDASRLIDIESPHRSQNTPTSTPVHNLMDEDLQDVLSMPVLIPIVLNVCVAEAQNTSYAQDLISTVDSLHITHLFNVLRNSVIELSLSTDICTPRIFSSESRSKEQKTLKNVTISVRLPTNPYAPRANFSEVLAWSLLPPDICPVHPFGATYESPLCNRPRHTLKVPARFHVW